MQRTNYNFPTSIRFGEGVIDELSDYLGNNGLQKPLIVTDPMLETLEVFKNAIAPVKSNIVFCHTSTLDGDPDITFYAGANIEFINLSANGIQSILYDFICMLRAYKGKGICILMGCSGGIFVPLFRLLGFINNF